MELQEQGYGKCCFAEEEITLTPYHTPSQSFDFIVWEKAYLDSISAETTSSTLPTSTTTTTTTTISSNLSCDDHIQCCKASKLGITQSYINHTESDPQSLCTCVPLDSSIKNDTTTACGQTSIYSSKTLLACKTDADLPPCFLDHKLRLSDGESYTVAACSCARFTSLEEAVCRSLYAKARRSTWRRKTLFVKDYGTQQQHRYPCCNNSHVVNEKQLTTHSSCRCDPHGHAKSESSSTLSKPLYLRRSISQPGALKSAKDGSPKLSGTCKHNGTGGHMVLHPSPINHIDQCNDSMWLQHQAQKTSCFPTGSSPSRRKRQQSLILEMPSSMGAPIYEYPRKYAVREDGQLHDVQYQDNFITLDVHIHQVDSQGPQSGMALTPSIHAVARMPQGQHSNAAPAVPSHDWSRSLSEKSSQYSFNDQFPVQNAMMSKLKWGTLNHKLKALCRKFCSTCPQHV